MCTPPGTSELKFVAEKLRLGKPIETSLGLHKLLGLGDEEELAKLRAAGEAAIVDEINLHGTHGRDLHGWSDADWLR